MQAELVKQKSLAERSIEIALCLYLASSLISMATMSIGVGLLFAALVTVWVRGAKVGCGFQNRQERFLFFVSLGVALSMAISLALVSRWADLSWVRDLGKIWYFALPFAVLWAASAIGSEGVFRAIRVWIGTFTVISLIGVIQFFVGWPRPQEIPGLPGYFHATLFLGHHLSVASIWIFPFFFVLDWGGVRYFLPKLLGFLTLFFTYSRMLWVALPAGLWVWLLMRLNRKQAIVSTALLGVAVLGLWQVPQIQNRMRDALGTQTRYALWEANFELLKKHPFFGVGFKKNQEAAGKILVEKTGNPQIFVGHAHNSYLDVFAGTGIVGGTLWLVYLGLITWILILLVIRKGPGSRGILAAWIVFLLNGVTQQNFWEGKVTHQLMIVLGLSLYHLRKLEYGTKDLPTNSPSDPH